MDRLLGPVDVFDEIDQPTGIVEGPPLHLVLNGGALGGHLFGGLRCFGVIADDLVHDLCRRDPLIGEVDGQPFIEERHFLQPPSNGLEVVGRGLEDIGIGPEAKGRTGFRGCITLLESSWDRPIVGLVPLVAVAADVDFEPRGQRSQPRRRHRGDHPTPGRRRIPNLPPACRTVITTSTVGAPEACIATDSTAVVADLDTPVFRRRTSTWLAYPAIASSTALSTTFPDQVVQSTLACRPDVHAGTFADSLQSFEDGDGLGAVLCGALFSWAATVGQISSGFGGERFVRPRAGHP